MNIALLIIIFISFTFIYVYLAKKNNLNFTIILFLFIYHQLTSVAKYYWSLNYPADSNFYYAQAISDSISFETLDLLNRSTDAVILFIKIMYDIAALSKFETFLVFGMFGFLGSLFLYSSLNKFETNKLYVYLVLFLPNFHWWTSGIGKDAIICTTFLGALYFIVNRKFFSFFLVSLIVIGFLIRSHTVTMIIISLGMCYFLKPSEFPNVAKFFFPVILLVAIVFGAPIVANKVSIQSLDSVELIERMELQTERNLKGSTSFDISSYPPPLRLFTFMYRPLFLDASGAMGLMISFENAILLLLSFLAFRNLKIVYARDKQLPLEIVYCILVIALIWIMLGMTTANLGLAIRQKNQITPYIYYLFVISDYLKRRKV